MNKANEWSQWMKICNKWVKDMKRRGQKEHSKQGDKQNKFIYYNKTDIDTLKIVVCVCVCVCVWLTQLNYKKVNDENVLLSWITYLKCLFLFVVRNSQFLRDWKKSHSQCILKKWMSARLIHFFFFFFAFHSCWWIRRMSHWRETVSALQWKLGKKKRKKSVWRRRIYRKYVSWNRLQKMQDEIYAGIVLRRSRGSPGQ